MSSYLIDSDVLVDFFKKKDPAVGLITKLSRTENIAASILSVTELRAGWSRKEAEFFLPRFAKLFTIENITLKIAELAGKFRREYKTKGRSLPTIDTLIAATAIINNHILVTKNKRHFPMPEVKLYK